MELLIYYFSFFLLYLNNTWVCLHVYVTVCVVLCASVCASICEYDYVNVYKSYARMLVCETQGALSVRIADVSMLLCAFLT